MTIHMPDKLLWGEGLFLRPQHFQQQDRYHEARLHEISSGANPFGWGLRSLKVDAQALAMGKLRILEITAVFPDGEPYSAPARDILPPDISIADTSLTEGEIVFHITMANLKTFGSDACRSGENGDMTRYRIASMPTRDSLTQAPEADLSYLKKMARVVPADKVPEGFCRLPLLALRRSSSGTFEIHPSFIPPSMHIHASPMLKLQLLRLLDALEAKVNALQGHHREPSKNVIEFRSGDISSFWLLHTASSAYAGLLHYLQQPDLHPERLFERLLSLAGALLTFSKSYRLSDLPPYQHSDPGPCFGKLFLIIRELLETVISSRYLAIALTETKPSYYHGQLDSGKINEKSAFFLAVSADLPGVELVEAIPLRFKVGAPDDVDKLVLSAMPGVKLLHASQTPQALPIRPDTYYFNFDSKSQLYERMVQAQVVSIYAPCGIGNLRLELFAIAS